MSSLDPKQLHVRFLPGAEPEGPQFPRRYTLTHSDASGELFLAIGADYDRRAISGWYTRLMRDEVLAEWQDGDPQPLLHVYCHVNGGIALGTASWRDQTLHHHMPLVLQALRLGDEVYFISHPNFDAARVTVHFQAKQKRYHREEDWGVVRDYRLEG